MGEIFGLDGGIMKFLSKVSDICTVSYTHLTLQTNSLV